MAQFSPNTWLDTLGNGRGYGDFGMDHTMVIGRRLTTLQAASAVHFILGMNGHALGFLCDEGDSTQLRGKHIFEHAREFIAKNHTPPPATIQHEGHTYKLVK